MVALLTVRIRRLREEIAQAEWSGQNADALRLQLKLALAAHERGEVWWVSF